MHQVVRSRGALLPLLALLLIPATAIAGRPTALVADNGFGPTDRPVYFLISLADTFETPFIDKMNGGLMNQAEEMGSMVMLVPVGVYVAGAEIEDTRYEGNDTSFIDLENLPPDPDTGLPLLPETLDMNPVSVVGSFCTFNEQIHMVTPSPILIAPQVQEAFFRASAFFDQIGPFATTVEIACFVYENQGDAGADINDIMTAMFTSPMELSCTTCFTEGDLFPHEPDGSTLFNFDVRFDTDTGDFELNICLPIAVWIKGQDGSNPFNLGSNGVLPVVVPTTPHFDAVEELDVSSLQIGTFVVDAAGIEVFDGVPIVKCTVIDQDGDGDLDVVVHFDTQAIVALPGVDENTTELRFAGETYAGMCVEGADLIKVVPPTK
jgi:hypothetical protein